MEADKTATTTTATATTTTTAGTATTTTTAKDAATSDPAEPSRASVSADPNRVGSDAGASRDVPAPLVTQSTRQAFAFADAAGAKPKLDGFKRLAGKLSKQARVVKVMRRDGGAIECPDPKLLRTWYALDANCMPPVYRLQRIRWVGYWGSSRPAPVYQVVAICFTSAYRSTSRGRTFLPVFSSSYFAEFVCGVF